MNKKLFIVSKKFNYQKACNLANERASEENLLLIIPSIKNKWLLGSLLNHKEYYYFIISNKTDND